MSNVQLKELGELAASMLTRTERLVVILYYFEQLTMHDIGDVLGMTEGRISQLHSGLVAKLRKRLAKLN